MQLGDLRKGTSSLASHAPVMPTMILRMMRTRPQRGRGAKASSSAVERTPGRTVVSRPSAASVPRATCSGVWPMFITIPALFKAAAHGANLCQPLSSFRSCSVFTARFIFNSRHIGRVSGFSSRAVIWMRPQMSRRCRLLG